MTKRTLFAAVACLASVALAGACKSSSGSGGSTGVTSTTGATSTNATGSTGTGPTCIANSPACDACVTTTFCKSQLAACAPDMACATAVNTSQNCVCAAQGANSQAQQNACITTVMNSGMLAAAVSTCIATNCKAQCLI